MRMRVGCVALLVLTMGCRSHAGPAPSVSAPGVAKAADLPGVPCGRSSRGVAVRYLPADIAIACGDNGMRATRLTWQGWTSRRALARGVLVQNDCRPTCVGGHLVDYPGARFEFVGPLNDDDFSTVVVTFEAGRTGPDGRRRLVHRL
jgi:hypothetical protein